MVCAAIANSVIFVHTAGMTLVIKENEPLAGHTIYKIGGPARFFAEVKNRAELEEALQFAIRKGLAPPAPPLNSHPDNAGRSPGANFNAGFFIMGAGSNILISDRGFDGMVIRLTGGEIRIEGEQMIVSAGVMMARAAAEAAAAGLAGFAWAIGVPGSIGGSVRGNAGCFGYEMRDAVESVDVFDALQITDYKLQTAECAFAYRHSIFKQHPEWAILSATLKLRKGETAAIQREIRAMSVERAAKQDIGSKSCGCIFKNPPWPDGAEAKEKILAQFPELAVFAARPEIPAAFLIDRAGLKGKRAGHIIVSDKHANFFINEGGGTAEDARSLIAVAQKSVQEKYGISLREEIQYIGF